jgi:hypothetical protein
MTMRVIRSGVCVALFVLLSVRAALGAGIPSGLGFLLSNQNADGTWGSAGRSQFRDTAVVLDTLALLGQTGQAFSAGSNGLASLAPRNHDDLARQTASAASAGVPAMALVDKLLWEQGSEVFDPTDPSFPGRAWAVATGFGASPLDTALVMKGLRAAGVAGGLAVVKEPVLASASSPAHAFQLPPGAASFFLKVRQLTGNARFTLTQPDSSQLYVDVSPGGVPVNIGPLPSLPGEWSLEVKNLTAGPITYTAEMGFTTVDGFDVFRSTTAYTYLALSQNADGGWGVVRGQDSHLMVTSEILRGLATTKGFVGPSVLASGAAYLLTRHQNADGGFSSTPTASNVNETALATLAVALADPLWSPASATAFLGAAQQANGSWGDDAYQTAIAMQALMLSTTPRAPDITSNGGAGAGAPFLTDLASVVISGNFGLGVVDIVANVPGATVVIDGATGAFRVTVPLAEGLNHITLTAVDGFGRPGGQTSLDVTRDSSLIGQDLVLEQGLNLIGLRVDPANSVGAIDLLEMLGPGALEVRRLNPTTKTYETTARSGSGFVGSNFPLAGLDGLLIVSTAPASQPSTARIVGSARASPSVHLLAGTNLITIPDPPEGLDAFALLGLIGDEAVVSAIQRVDTASGRLESAVYRGDTPAGVNFPIEAGVSYLVHMRMNVFDFALPVGVVVEVQITSPADGAIVTASPVSVAGTVAGEAPLTVAVNGVPATVASGAFTAIVPLTPGLNTLTANARDGGGRAGSDAISVTFEAVDFSIPRNGSASGTRSFTAASSLLDQVAYYTETQVGVPPGIVYQTTSVSRPSATEIRVGFRISATAAATPGIHQFQVEYGLLDAGSNPLGPLTGNVFEFRIEVTP